MPCFHRQFQFQYQQRRISFVNVSSEDILLQHVLNKITDEHDPDYFSINIDNYENPVCNGDITNNYSNSCLTIFGYNTNTRKS